MTVAIIGASVVRDKLQVFAPSVEGSTLYILRAIEETVDTLQAEESLAGGMSEVSNKLADEIRASEVVTGCLIDPDDKALNKIESAYKALEERLPKLLVKKSSVDKARDLDAEQRELLHIAYERCIDTMATLIEAAKNLRAAVISHDLAAEGAPGQMFDSPGELVDSLHSG